MRLTNTSSCRIANETCTLRDTHRRDALSMATFTLPDATLRYDQTGNGPDIVWLAAGDHPGKNWRLYQTPAFEPRYRNTTYDARGVGDTVSSAEPPWPIETHARDVAALVEAVCTPPVFLVGLSMGSLIAVQTAYERPDLVRCAVVMGTCVRKTGFIREWEQAEVDLRARGDTLPPDFATAHYALLYFPAEVLGNDELWARVRPFIAADFEERDGTMLSAQWQACLDYDSSALLPRIQVPIHAVAFAQDVQTPPQRVREVADLAADGHYHELAGCGHGSAFGHRPDLVNECIAGILARYAS
jgi:pimeloyl-ACP methyl ester carboxylesterase